jgi:REP element-mobilizing transposase RayT
MKQQQLITKHKKAYGGTLLNTRKGRKSGRPLSTRATMHLVLKSSQAKEAWSFTRFDNDYKIRDIVEKFSEKYGIKILSLANVGNHLHFHIKLSNRFTYRAFIRAVTAAIAMAITGASRLKPLKEKFWDYRPFSRIIESFKDFLGVSDYLEINRLEGIGMKRSQATWIIASNSS